MKIQADAALAQRNAELQNQLEASKQRFQAEQAQQETQLEAQRNEAERNNLMMIEQFKVQKQMELEQFKAQVERDKAIAIAEINAAAKVEAARVQGVKQDQGAAEFVQGANDAAVGRQVPVWRYGEGILRPHGGIARDARVLRPADGPGFLGTDDHGRLRALSGRGDGQEDGHRARDPPPPTARRVP